LQSQRPGTEAIEFLFGIYEQIVFCGHVTHDNIRSGSGESHGDRFADTPPAACDNRAFAFQKLSPHFHLPKFKTETKCRINPKYPELAGATAMARQIFLQQI
jgi:hypothetical protein